VKTNKLYKSTYRGILALPQEEVVPRKSVKQYVPMQLPQEEVVPRKSVKQYVPMQLPQEEVVPRKSVVDYKEELQDIRMFQALIEKVKINDNNSKRHN
jgi:hypothetical protein